MRALSARRVPITVGGREGHSPSSPPSRVAAVFAEERHWRMQPAPGSGENVLALTALRARSARGAGSPLNLNFST